MVEHVNTCWKSRPLYLERLTLVVVGKSRATTTIGDKVKGGDCCCSPVVAVDLKLNHFRIYYINSFDIRNRLQRGVRRAAAGDGQR
jgi:hypothetical protein